MSRVTPGESAQHQILPSQNQLTQPTQSKLSPLAQHYQKWCNGCGSPTCPPVATNVCIVRGTVPCDILFVAEAPGISENSHGQPLKGPAGKSFDEDIVSRSISPKLRIAYNNLVACLPVDEEGRKAGQPDYDTIIQCQPRLIEFVNLCNPKLIVCVGSMARDALDPKTKGTRTHPRFNKPTYWLEQVPYDELLPPFEDTPNPKDPKSIIYGRIALVTVVHPSAILQSNTAMQGVAIRNCITTLQSAIARLGMI